MQHNLPTKESKDEDAGKGVEEGEHGGEFREKNDGKNDWRNE